MISNKDNLLNKSSTMDKKLSENEDDKKRFFQRQDLVYSTIILQIVITALAFYSAYNYPFLRHYKTTVWAMLVSIYVMFGTAGGAHRLWSHRSYKANAPLRAIIAVGHATSLHSSIELWVRYHRVHHKYTDTEADPHNASRGFFYSHMGWAFYKRSQLLKDKFKQIDMTDISNDRVVTFVDRYRYTIGLLVNLATIAVPVYLWGETWYYSALAQVLRFFYNTHAVLSINSFAHTFGSRPFDKKIAPAENKLVVFLTNGDGWHNYHHSFPVDYRSAEIGGSTRYDINARLIEFFAKIGWAWDLKMPKESLVKATMRARGDGSVTSSMIT